MEKAGGFAMTFWGWFFLIVSWGILTYFTVWCMYKILKTPFEKEEEPPRTA